jgi:hypothetical protein
MTRNLTTRNNDTGPSSIGKRRRYRRAAEVAAGVSTDLPPTNVVTRVDRIYLHSASVGCWCCSASTSLARPRCQGASASFIHSLHSLEGTVVTVIRRRRN